MPIPMPKRLFDSLIGHNVDLLRVEAQFNREIRALLEKMKRDLLAQIADSGLDAQRTDWQRARLRDLLNAANKRIGDTYDTISARMDTNLQDLAGTSTKILVDGLNKSIDVDLFSPIQWTDETLHRIVSDTLINGAKSSEWWSRQKASFTQKFSDEMRMGMLRGETLDQLRNRIVPRVDLRKEPDWAKRDLIKTARRNAEALVRTSTLTVMREAHLDVFEANADIIASVQWVSTLDNRTTPLCRHLDGLEWTIPGYEPKGHNTQFPGTSAHWNCRSVVIPITKTWEQLAKEAGGDAEFAKKLDAIPRGERASMGGPVDAGTTYETWFAEQDRERQLEILGPGRMEMYEKGVLSVSNMVDMGGNPLSLDELKKEANSEDVVLFEAVRKHTLGKTECSVPVEYGDLNDMSKKVYSKYPEAGTYVEQNYDSTAGLCTWMYNSSSGKHEPVHIGINEKLFKEWVKKGSMEHIINGDGYRMYKSLTAEQQMKLTVCHEIAHSMQTDLYTRDFQLLGGHTQQHEELTNKLISLVCPEILNIPHRKGPSLAFRRALAELSAPRSKRKRRR